ncbi:MAG: restriction endonuclease subunit S [Vibrio sp.]
MSDSLIGNSLITEHMDIWTSAIKPKSASGRGTSKKVELYGIKKLRELILELAVRGKLVPQDPNDEPASVLLERIAAEKAQLVKEKKIKKPKALPEISDEEKSFDLPSGWEWSRLGNIVKKLTDGSHNPARDTGSGYPMFSSQNVHFGKIDFSNPSRYVDENNYLKEHSRTQIETDDVLLTIVGTLGRAAVVPSDAPKFVLQRSVAVIRANLSANFLVNYFASLTCIKYFDENGKGTAQKGIYLGKLSLMPIAIPTLQEQHRIVAKVDELMALCDQLESQTENQLETHQQLVQTLLDTLTNCKNHAELQQNWALLAENFDALFTTEQSIDLLKQTILQLAVMGKLVPQDPNDEPASKLLERIAAEKDQLIKDKKIKKQKALPPISEDEKPFKLPSGWEWCRIFDVSMFTTSGSRDWAKYYSESGALFVTMGNLSRGSYQLRLDNKRYVQPPKDGEGSRTKLEANDLLISITGDVGNLGLIPENFGEAYINQHTCLLRFMPETQGRFFPEFMRSPMAKFQFDAPQRGIKNSFRLSDVAEIVLALPPKQEQHRIVTKVDELMAICDDLKSKLAESQQTQLHLTNAIVEQVV